MSVDTSFSILPPIRSINQTSPSMTEQFGVYVHIPYCLQRCTYCDFATYVHTEILPSHNYVELVKKEIALKKHLYPARDLDTLYFGGGTPSLIPASEIISILDELNAQGFKTHSKTEITIEINPATVSEKKLNEYLEKGINRFSVGAQSFSDRLLKMVHREHNSAQTLETLKLLETYKLNYSFDVLFALPTQTLKELEYDLDVATSLGMKHVSPYCLTVNEGHPLSKNRPADVTQLEMFDLIDRKLTEKGFNRYEISNYALPGFESKHNLLYWIDQPYWGLGLSAHSYSKIQAWGRRSWNHSNIHLYEKSLLARLPVDDGELSETLAFHQSLTDFCHTSLRLMKGLSAKALLQKFGPRAVSKVHALSGQLIQRGLLVFKDDYWALTSQGIYVSNQIFENYTFLQSDFT